MRRVNKAQMKKLLDLLSEDRVLVKGKVSYYNTDKQSFWKRVALELNSVEGGVYKNTWKWCKMWADWKNKTKKKANILLWKKHYTHGQQQGTLTNLELRLLKMIDYPKDDKAGVLDLGMISKIESPEGAGEGGGGGGGEGDGGDGGDEFDTESFDDGQTSENPLPSDTDDHGGFQGSSKDDGGGGKFESCAGPSREKKVKMKGSKEKKYSRTTRNAPATNPLQEYKIKASLALEKERIAQKSEELRLKALELKLKGDELRQKEIEMNKINYLTNVEEEKLKCFKEISSSLKELLDRTRNGNFRFPNLL